MKHNITSCLQHVLLTHDNQETNRIQKHLPQITQTLIGILTNVYFNSAYVLPEKVTQKLATFTK